MTWTLGSSLEEFRAEAGVFLAARPAENTVLLSIAHRLGTDGPDAFGDQPPGFGWWRPAPQAPVAGAFVRTPPFPPRLGLMPAAAGAELAVLMHGLGLRVERVNGGRQAALAFAEAWQRLTGGTTSVDRQERLHRLGELCAPVPAPSGRSRAARAGDRALLVRWFGEFAAEAGIRLPADVGALVDGRTAAGTLTLWEDGGRPVSFAGVGPLIAATVKVGPVYTPPGLRGRGYASALVAAGSADALARGAAEVLLHTDLANPTSNAIYRRLGYRPVQDEVALDLGRPGGA
ncbi:GNAT family N-acetyltransferase [Kitasatospora sp. NBC_00374]|uniref:GNAT family N-acetyltransferase n=1 Tax=Kitasatospora sp. NBC_00374 TaxID=2975964 RepID=UPI0030DF1693